MLRYGPAVDVFL